MVRIIVNGIWIMGESWIAVHSSPRLYNDVCYTFCINNPPSLKRYVIHSAELGFFLGKAIF